MLSGKVILPYPRVCWLNERIEPVPIILRHPKGLEYQSISNRTNVMLYLVSACRSMTF